jgi:hypothetical protein
MAISIVGSITEQVSPASTSVGLLNGNHTVDAGTDLLLCCIAMEGGEILDSSDPVKWNLAGVDEILTLISDSGAGADNSDVRTWVYGYVNPTAVDTGQTGIGIQFSANQVAATWINISGVNTDSVAAATNDLETVSNTSAGSTTAFSSAGATGNGLLVWSAAQNQSMAPSSADNGFTEQVDSVTAATSSDFAFNLSTLLSGAPSAVTVTWNTTNENAGNLIELVPASSTSILPDYSGTRGVMRGVGRGT